MKMLNKSTVDFLLLVLNMISFVYLGMNCRLYGWGQYQKDPPPNQCKNHKTLEFIELGQIDSDICQRDYDDQGWEIYDSNICAGVVSKIS